MPDISFVVICRDDGYGECLEERFSYTLEENLRLFRDNGLSVEYIVVDWSPLSTDRYLYKNEKFSKFLLQAPVRNIIVDNSVLISEGLTSGRFYEYFAKNTGMKRATGEFLLVTNFDVFLMQSTIDGIKDVLLKDSDFLHSHFFRCRYRNNYLLSGKEVVLERKIDLDIDVSDRCICGAYSGDFLLIHKTLNIGYNEGDAAHRSNRIQTGMDGEILWSLYHAGKRMVFVDGEYGHTSHRKPEGDKDIYREGISYTNKPDWGFVNYRSEKISENTEIILAE
jgi:hypothetical protein